MSEIVGDSAVQVLSLSLASDTKEDQRCQRSWGILQSKCCPCHALTDESKVAFNFSY